MLQRHALSPTIGYSFVLLADLPQLEAAVWPIGRAAPSAAILVAGRGEKLILVGPQIVRKKSANVPHWRVSAIDDQHTQPSKYGS